jgi:hypothetical protein
MRELQRRQQPLLEVSRALQRRAPFRDFVDVVAVVGFQQQRRLRGPCALQEIQNGQHLVLVSEGPSLNGGGPRSKS